MKVRAGFVSNSSTCSFVICGFKIPETGYQYILQRLTGITTDEIILEMKKDDHYRKKEIIEQSHIDNFCADKVYDIKNKKDKDIDILMGEGVDGVVVGVEIFNADGEDYIPNQEIDLTEIQERLDNIRDRLKLGSIPAKIFSGTYQC